MKAILLASVGSLAAATESFAVGAVHAVQPRRAQQSYPCTTSFGSGVNYDLSSLSAQTLFFAYDNRNNNIAGQPVYDFYYAVCHDISEGGAVLLQGERLFLYSLSLFFCRPLVHPEL
jgi:hypothetical protein